MSVTDAHSLDVVAQVGPWGGCTMRYRGGRIECLRGDQVCGLFMDGHSLSGKGIFGVPGTITPLIDSCLDTGQLPAYRQPKF